MRPWPKWLLWPLKLGLSALLLWWLLAHQKLQSPFGANGLGKAWGTLALMAAILGVAFVIQAVRWRLILRSQEVAALRFSKVFRLTLIGVFFSNLMVGSTGGDAVKAYYVGKATHRYFAAAGTLFLDRAIGLAALAFMALGGVALGISTFYERAGGVASMRLFLVLLPIGAGLFLAVRYWHHLSRWTVRLWRALARKEPLGAGSAPGMLPITSGNVAILLGLSLVSQFLFILSTYVGWRLIGGEEASLRTCLTFVPLAFVANALPISLGGLGVGEAGLGGLFSLIGSAHGAQVFLLFRIPLIFWAVVGALAYALPGGHLAAEEERGYTPSQNDP